MTWLRTHTPGEAKDNGIVSYGGVWIVIKVGVEPGRPYPVDVE